MVMIAADNCCGMLPDPLNAGERVDSVVDDVAEEQAGIE
jgi:hypothetical protein